MPDLTTMSASVQYGFAGFAFCMLSVIVWQFWQLIKVLKENNKVISENSNVISKTNDITAESRELLIDIKDRLLERPCMMQQANRLAIADNGHT